MRIFCCSDDNSDKSSCIIRCIKQQSSTLSVKSAFVCGMLSSINPDASFRLSYLKYECPVNGNISIHQIVNSSFLKTDQETHICRTAVACSKLFLQFGHGHQPSQYKRHFSSLPARYPRGDRNLCPDCGVAHPPTGCPDPPPSSS